MSDLKIAIIVGSTRPGRVSPQVAQWVFEQAQSRDAVYEIVDIESFDLPLLDEPVPPSVGMPPQHEHTKKWAATIDQYDGYVFVSPEYNHSLSGALKNAIDYVYKEWNNKAAGFVSWGGAGGSRQIEHLRGIAGELQLADVRQTVMFSLFTDFEEMRTFKPAEHHAGSAEGLFSQVEAWAGALKTLRASGGTAAAAAH